MASTNIQPPVPVGSTTSLPDNETAPLVDCLIIGGGIAGLSTATSLVRTLHTAVVFDTHQYRNGLAPHLATIPSWDSQDPHAFREAAKADILGKYSTVQFADVLVERIEKVEAGKYAGTFCGTDSRQRRFFGKKAVLAMGVKDVFPDVPGYAECWATGIFHCLVHRGYEERSCSSAGILSIDTDATLFAARHLAFQARNLTPTVTIYTNDNAALTTEIFSALTPLGFTVDGRRIRALQKGAARATVDIIFENGGTRTEGFLVHRPRVELNGPFAQQLGVEMAAEGHVKTSFPFNETSVPGVFVAGDAGSMFRIGTQAVVMGAFAAGGVQAQINAENWGAGAKGT